MTDGRGRPAHGGYPTPTYRQAPERRRRESERIWGHTGAWVAGAVEEQLDASGRTEKVSDA